MNNSILKAIALSSVLLFTCLTTADVHAAETKFNAGFIALSSTEQAPEMGIWYPSTSAETTGELGPFRPTWAWDGDAADGVFPVIVLSHGHTGRYRNHRQTAATLARNGYVVVAPDHLHDRQMTSAREIVSVVTQRVAELKLALSAVHTHPFVGKIVDMNRAGAVGYSLGTLTALYAAGATPQMARFSQHCEQHRKEDNNFCGDGWMSGFLTTILSTIKSTLSWLKEKKILRPTKNHDLTKEFLPMESPINFSAIALVAPVGVPFSADALHGFVSSPTDIALFRLGDDEQLRRPYHAEHLYKLLGDKARVYKTYDKVHHYAFISPFPQWLLDEEYIPVAIDPENFDRVSFIRNINHDILNFFNEYL